MPAVSFSKGLCLTLTSGSQTMIQSYSSITALEAGKAYSLGSLVFKPATVTLGDVSTSYTKNGTVSKTNDIGGSEMRFGECSFTGISNAMVAQTGIEYNGTQVAVDRNGKTFAPATLTGLGWTSYKVRAYVKTVDGNTFYSPEKNAVVTGIPYTANAAELCTWSGGNKETWQNRIALKNGGYIISPAFYMPDNQDIKVTISAYVYGGTLTPRSHSIYISASASDSKSGTALTVSTSSYINFPDEAKWYSASQTIRFSSSVASTCIHADVTRRTTSIAAGPGVCVVVQETKLEYSL